MSLGSLSSKYEVGNNGIGTVSSGKGDAGGRSFGLYQMSSKPFGGTVARFVSQSDFPFVNEFKNLVPGTDGFTKVWKQLAVDKAEEFKNLQHDFIKRTHYDVLVNKIKTNLNIDINQFSNALQNVVWSLAVQHGGNNSIIERAYPRLINKDTNDKDFELNLIKSIYAERRRKDVSGNLIYFSKNSKAVQNGVENRFINEEKDALQMLKNG